VAQEITCIELINSVALVALGELSIAGAISREQSEASESGNQQRDFPNNVIIICLILGRSSVTGTRIISRRPRSDPIFRNNSLIHLLQPVNAR